MYRVITCALVSFFSVKTAIAETPRPITSTDLVNIRDIGGHHSGGMAVSPGGDHVAFQLQTPIVESANYNLKWYVAETKANGKNMDSRRRGRGYPKPRNVVGHKW